MMGIYQVFFLDGKNVVVSGAPTDEAALIQAGPFMLAEGLAVVDVDRIERLADYAPPSPSVDVQVQES